MIEAAAEIATRSLAAKVLIVEDKAPLAELLRYNFQVAGYEVLHAETGDDAETLVAEQAPDLVVLDWVLPSKSGIEICRRLRARSETGRISIILLTVRGDEAARLLSPSRGVDDYVVKPFSLPELMARAKVLLRRTAPKRMAEVLEVGDITLDRSTHWVMRGRREVRLSPIEFRLLEFFMQSPGRVHSREHLVDGVWGPDAKVEERTVDVHIRRLRKALMWSDESNPILTVRGAGYAFAGLSAAISQM